MTGGEKVGDAAAPAEPGDRQVADQALSLEMLERGLEVADRHIVCNRADPCSGGLMGLLRQLALSGEEVRACRQVAGAGVLVGEVVLVALGVEVVLDDEHGWVRRRPLWPAPMDLKTGSMGRSQLDVLAGPGPLARPVVHVRIAHAHILQLPTDGSRSAQVSGLGRTQWRM